MENDKIRIDPRTFKYIDTPILTLVDSRRPSVFGFGIKAHTADNYNHIMTIIRPGYFASQGLVQFSEVKMEEYMNDSNMLKFWTVRDMTYQERADVNSQIARRLSLPFIERGYDALGIFGQMTGLKFIQNPYQFFCSEQARKDFIERIKRADGVIDKYPSPGDFNRRAKQHPEIFKCLGYWWND